ncbi:hypothetical protein ACHAWF_012976 [Thalassiosira exigua]
MYKPAPHSMDGKLAVTTGGDTRLGLESTKSLPAAGATVVFTSRDNAKGRTAVSEVEEYLKRYAASDASFAGKAQMAQLDLCDLDNVSPPKIV